MIELKPVEGSSQIAASGYDPATQVLAIQFKSGKSVYHYQQVPEDVAAAFDAAESKGKFLGSEIKGTFEFEKVDVSAAEGE